MRRWTVLAAIVLLVWSWQGRGDALPAADSTEKLASFSKALHEAVEAKQIGGGSALVARQGRVVYFEAAGLADASPDRPMARDAIFRIASMTKPIMSVAAMILVDDGKLSVDDPVSKYIPEFAKQMVLADPKTGQTRPASREVRVRHLLTQTSGITYKFMNKPGIGEMYIKAGVYDGLDVASESLQANCRKIASLPLLNDPGAAWEYGLNTDVLGRVVEVASGQTLDEFFARRVLGPLKMNDTFFIVPAEKRQRLAAIFMPKNGGVERVRQTVVAGPLVWSPEAAVRNDVKYFSGGAGLCSTIDDYARFLQMLLNGGELDGVRVLKRETVEQMMSDQIAPLRVTFAMHGDGFGYGFGIMTPKADRKDGDPAPVGSFSWGGFYYTYFWGDPKTGVIGLLMTQTQPNGGLKLREALKKAVYEKIGEAAP
jgi:CubicO group peptidase (beta-lactamase class C family)